MKSKLLLLPLAIFFTQTLFGQSVDDITELDPTPFERPMFLTLVKASDARVLLDSIENIILAQGFSIDQRDDINKSMIVSRRSPVSGDAREKIMIWLERDFDNPEKNIKIYLIYGVFSKVFGSSEYKRVKLKREWPSLIDIRTRLRKINIP